MNMDGNGVEVAQPVILSMEALMEHFRGQLQRERDLFLAMVDERERLLGIEPRTAEIRRWWRERRE